MPNSKMDKVARRPIKNGQMYPIDCLKDVVYIVRELSYASNHHHIYTVRRVHTTKNKQRKVAVKSAIRDDELLNTIYYEKVVWAFLIRFAPFQRLMMPLEMCNKYSLTFPVMGPSLESIRKHHKGPFDLETTIRLALEMLAAIRELHECSLVHRNIKPSHFVLHSSNPIWDLYGKIMLVDLSQAHPYFQSAGHFKLPPLSADPDLMFSSPNPSVVRDSQFGRNDDLISWFFCVLYLRMPELPWARVTNPSEIKELKLRLMNSLPNACQVFGPIVGEAMYKIGMHLRMCSVTHLPRYGEIFWLLYDALRKITDDRLLRSYIVDGEFTDTKVLKPLKKAIVREPRFAVHSQDVELDVDYVQASKNFQRIFQEAGGEAVFNAVEEQSKACRNKFVGTYTIMRQEKIAAAVAGQKTKNNSDDEDENQDPNKEGAASSRTTVQSTSREGTSNTMLLSARAPNFIDPSQARVSISNPYQSTFTLAAPSASLSSAKQSPSTASPSSPAMNLMSPKPADGVAYVWPSSVPTYPKQGGAAQAKPANKPTAKSKPAHGLAADAALLMSRRSVPAPPPVPDAENDRVVNALDLEEIKKEALVAQSPKPHLAEAAAGKPVPPGSVHFDAGLSPAHGRSGYASPVPVSSPSTSASDGGRSPSGIPYDHYGPGGGRAASMCLAPGETAIGSSAYARPVVIADVKIKYVGSADNAASRPTNSSGGGGSNPTGTAFIDQNRSGYL